MYEIIILPDIFLWASGLTDWVNAAILLYSVCDIKPAASKLLGDMTEYSSLSNSTINASISKTKI